MNVFIDIETLPDMTDGAKDLIEVKPPATYKKAESIEKWMEANADAEKEKQWRKQALNPNSGRILSIAYSFGGDVEVICNRSLSEKGLLGQFALKMREGLDGRPPYFIGHNVQFDMGFLWKRGIINNVDLPSIKPVGRHGKDFFCTMTHWEGFKGRISQDNLCKLLGIEGKPDGVTGSTVLDYYLDKKYDDIAAYNQDDVEKVMAIYKRINK